MNEKKILRRKIMLKNQAIKIIRMERDALKQRMNLLSLKARLEGQMTDSFSPSLSNSLDCVQFLLETEMENRPRG